MSYVFNGITVDGRRLDASPTAGTAAGAVAALVMAIVWCAIAHLTTFDASLPIRAIAATVLGQPGDDDPRRTAIAIAIGLLLHFSIGMFLGSGLERAFQTRKPPRGALLFLTLGWGLLLASGPLARIAPGFLDAVPPPALIAGHLLFGIVLELTEYLRGEPRARTLRAALSRQESVGTG